MNKISEAYLKLHRITKKSKETMSTILLLEKELYSNLPSDQATNMIDHHINEERQNIISSLKNVIKTLESASICEMREYLSEGLVEKKTQTEINFSILENEYYSREKKMKDRNDTEYSQYLSNTDVQNNRMFKRSVYVHALIHRHGMDVEEICRLTGSTYETIHNAEHRYYLMPRYLLSRK